MIINQQVNQPLTGRVRLREILYLFLQQSKGFYTLHQDCFLFTSRILLIKYFLGFLHNFCVVILYIVLLFVCLKHVIMCCRVTHTSQFRAYGCNQTYLKCLPLPFSLLKLPCPRQRQIPSKFMSYQSHPASVMMRKVAFDIPQAGILKLDQRKAKSLLTIIEEPAPIKY